MQNGHRPAPRTSLDLVTLDALLRQAAAEEAFMSSDERDVLVRQLALDVAPR